MRPDTSLQSCFYEGYQARSVLPPRFRNDVVHIVLATIADAEFIALATARHVPQLAALTFITDLVENPDIEPRIISARKVMPTERRLYESGSGLRAGDIGMVLGCPNPPACQPL
jgi:hypothetical protein